KKTASHCNSAASTARIPCTARRSNSHGGTTEAFQGRNAPKRWESPMPGACDAICVFRTRRKKLTRSREVSSAARPLPNHSFRRQDAKSQWNAKQKKSEPSVSVGEVWME